MRKSRLKHELAPQSQKDPRKATRLQISHTIAPDLLAKVDRLAEQMGQSRAAVINLAVYKFLELEGST